MSEETIVLPRRSVLAAGAAAAAYLAAPGCASMAWTRDPWTHADDIVSSIRPVSIPNRQTNMRDHGAPVPGSGDARPAILAAIDSLAAQGGGRVVIPAGLWLCDGPIHLKSHIELHLAPGAHMRFLPNPERYLPPVFTRWEGTELYTYSPFIFAQGQTNVALTGSGKIDGQGQEYWLPWRETQKPTQHLLRDMGRDGVPVTDRIFIDVRRLRPHFVQFQNCTRVLIDGPTLVDSPFWMIHLLYSSDVIVRNVHAVSRHLNSDGVSVDSARRVLIENCDFDVGDDGVVIKAGRDQDGWRVARPAEDIVVRDCIYSGEAGGAFAVGSEMSGGVRRVFVDGFRLKKAKHMLLFKANLDRGGRISDVHIRNISAEETRTVLAITNDYHSYRGGTYPSVFEKINVSRVRVDRTDVGISIGGHEQAPVRRIVLRDIRMETAAVPLKLSHAEDVRLEDVKVAGAALTLADARPVHSKGQSR